MAIEGRRSVALHAVAGVSFAIVIIAGLFISGVVPSIQVPSVQGTLVVLLKDAPVNLTHLNVTIDNFSAHSQNDGWIVLIPPFSEGLDEVYFDLLALENEVLNLVEKEIPLGDYTRIRMRIKSANATFEDGSTADLRVPPGHIDVKIDFEIKEKETTILLIDMQPDRVAISKTNNLNPVLKPAVIRQP